MRGLDWPFVSELERATWQARSLALLKAEFASWTAELRDSCTAEIAEIAALSEQMEGDDASPELADLGALLEREVADAALAARLAAAAATERTATACAECAPILEYVALRDAVG